MRINSAFVRGVFVAGAFLTSAEAWAQAKGRAEKPPEPPPLPPASARLWLVAPTARGPWTMRIENEGSVAVRIPADGRLLRLEVQTDPEAKPVSCVLPTSLRPKDFPEDRALLLAPGHFYEQAFDPELFCFGKSAVPLGPNVIVHAKFGWEPPKVPKWKAKSKKPPTGPFAVESTEREPTVGSLWELQAPSILLGAATAAKESDTKPATKDDAGTPKTDAKDGENPSKDAGTGEEKDGAKPPPIVPTPVVDERAGKLELTSTPFVEASAPRTVTVKVTAKNAGLRPIVVALRSWMMSFRIDGPGGDTQMCYADNTHRVLPSDAYRSLEPGKSTSFNVLLAEVCPRTIFTRPGLYRVTAMIAAKETTNKGADVTTTDVTAQEPSLVRLTGAEEPFYAEPPKAMAPAVVASTDSE